MKNSVAVFSAMKKTELPKCHIHVQLLAFKIVTTAICFPVNMVNTLPHCFSVRSKGKVRPFTWEKGREETQVMLTFFLDMHSQTPHVLHVLSSGTI